MSSRHIQLQPAFVLHHRPYRDTSRILELFTRDHGRVTLFARGARGSGRKGTSPMSMLQPFNRLLVSWTTGADAGTLTSVEFDGESLFQSVRTSAQFAPVRITGTIAGVDVPSSDELAIAMNGRIAGLSPAFRVDGVQRFSTLVPESSLRNGDNLVVLYRIDDGRARVRLVELGRNDLGAAYVLADDAHSIRVAGGGSVVATSTRLVGRVERFALLGGMARLRGWAADARARSVPDRILVFADARAVYATETMTLRWDVQAISGVGRSGWTAEFPSHAARGASIRVFALRGAVASELPWSAVAGSARDHGT